MASDYPQLLTYFVSWSGHSYSTRRTWSF